MSMKVKNWDKYFYKNKSNLLNKVKLHSIGRFKGEKRPRMFTLYGFYFSKNKVFKKKDLMYKDNTLLLSLRRKTVFYIKPFIVNRLFISKLVQSKILKRLATIW